MSTLKINVSIYLSTIALREKVKNEKQNDDKKGIVVPYIVLCCLSDLIKVYYDVLQIVYSNLEP